MAASARYLFAWIVVGVLLLGTALAVEDDEDGDDVAVEKESTGINCGDGLLIPIWPGFESMSMGDRFGRGLSTRKIERDP